MQHRDIKKRHKQDIPLYAVSLPAPDRSGFRSFPMMREPAPHLRSDADDAQAGNVQRRLTAAGEEDPLVSESPSAMLMPKTGPQMGSHPTESCHGIQYITFPCALQWENLRKSSLFPAEMRFFPTCTSLLYKFCRENLRPESRQRAFFRKKTETTLLFSHIGVY